MAGTGDGHQFPPSVISSVQRFLCSHSHCARSASAHALRPLWASNAIYRNSSGMPSQEQHGGAGRERREKMGFYVKSEAWSAEAPF